MIFSPGQLFLEKIGESVKRILNFLALITKPMDNFQRIDSF